jgi:hypothetical protein
MDRRRHYVCCAIQIIVKKKGAPSGGAPFLSLLVAFHFHALIQPHPKKVPDCKGADGSGQIGDATGKQPI